MYFTSSRTVGKSIVPMQLFWDFQVWSAVCGVALFCRVCRATRAAVWVGVLSLWCFWLQSLSVLSGNQTSWFWALLCFAVCGRRHMAEQDKKGFILVFGTCWGWDGIQFCLGSDWPLWILRTLSHPVIILQLNSFFFLLLFFFFWGGVVIFETIFLNSSGCLGLIL